MSGCAERDGSMRIVDLTHPTNDAMPVCPGDPAVKFTRVSTATDAGYNVTEVCFGTHTGTHMDAPYHVLDGQATVDHIPLEALIGPAEVLDLFEKGPKSEIEFADLERFAHRIEPGCRLLLRTDWSTRFGQPDFFTDGPGIAPDAAKWLAAKGVRLLGLEQPSVSNKHSLEVHSILLDAGIVLVETMANLADLREQRVWLIVLPLKLAGLDGSPVRAIAIEGADIVPRS